MLFRSFRSFNMNIKPTIVGLSLATIFSATLEAGPK